MKSKEDRTGVLRRQLFQVVKHDLKKAPQVSLPSSHNLADVAPRSSQSADMDRLAELVAMRREGFLDASEFVAAKRNLLGL